MKKSTPEGQAATAFAGITTFGAIGITIGAIIVGVTGVLAAPVTIPLFAGLGALVAASGLTTAVLAGIHGYQSKEGKASPSGPCTVLTPTQVEEQAGDFYDMLTTHKKLACPEDPKLRFKNLGYNYDHMCKSDGQLNPAYVTNFEDGNYATQFPYESQFGDYFEVLFQEEISLVHAITTETDASKRGLKLYWDPGFLQEKNNQFKSANQKSLSSKKHETR